MPNVPVAQLDFETRSACSIKNSGSWRYSLDPSTDVLCAAFRLPHWPEGKTGLWHPAFPDFSLKERTDDGLDELFMWVREGRLLEAHNSFFERGIWTNKLQFWPTVRPEQWRCSAAKAASHALPRALRDAARALHLDIRKDDSRLRTALDLDGDSQRVMTKLSQPRKPTKADRYDWGILHAGCRTCCGSGKVAGINPETGRAKQQPCPRCKGLGYKGRVPTMPLLWHESRGLLTELFEYCRRDVLAEEALGSALPDLNAAETGIFILDQTINERGLQLDAEAVEAAEMLIEQECRVLNAELCELTGGMVAKATQRDQMKEWLASEGLKLFDTRKETLDELLDREDTPETEPWMLPPPPKARRGLELMRALGRSSTAKYSKMKQQRCPDWRVRGSMLYHGAGTGRWAGKGIQPHNFPKGSQAPALKKCTQDELWADLKTRDAGLVRAKYGNVMEALSHGLRGAIIASPGHQLYVADYAAIEARAVNWLAGNEDALNLFRTGADIYCDMADDVYGYPTNKKEHPVERGLGKIAVLGLGYQMGPSKFVESCALAGVTIAEDSICSECGLPSRQHRRANHEFECDNPDEITAVKVVDTYRAKYWRVKDMWADYEAAAIAAVEYDDYVESGFTAWFVEGDFLYCQLPNGRRLAYPEPEVRQVKMFGKWRDQLTFMGINQYNHQWERQHTYGGSLVENVTQAVSRDVMAEAMVRCEQSGLYIPVLTVHDEIVAEAPLGKGSVHDFEALVSVCPEWAPGFPVAAEGWSGVRYRK